jgi:hypothetical protein
MKRDERARKRDTCSIRRILDASDARIYSTLGQSARLEKIARASQRGDRRFID